MKKENAHLFIPFVEALAKGKTVLFDLNEDGSDWTPLESYLFDHEPEAYKIQEFDLNNLLGFRPLQGEEKWHRADFTEEDLKGGYRPLLYKEKIQMVDECFDMSWINRSRTAEGLECISTHLKTRTKRPFPSIELLQHPDGLELHNPDNLTGEQVGAGYRLLTKSEVDGKWHTVANSTYWRKDGLGWDNSFSEWRWDTISTIRVPVSYPWPEKEKKLVPLTLDEWSNHVGAILIQKVTGERRVVISAFLCIHVGELTVSSEEVMEEFTFADGSPCGKYE